jgi:hypothetical protein
VEHPSSEDRLALDLAVDESNLRAFGPWALIGSVVGLALLLSLLDLSLASAGQLWAPLALVLGGALAAALLAWLKPAPARRLTSQLSLVLVALLSLALAWVLVRVPASLAVVACGTTLVALSAGLVFTWRLPQAIAAQLLILGPWVLGLALGPAASGMPGQLAGWSALLLGGPPSPCSPSARDGRRPGSAPSTSGSASASPSSTTA